ncbi:MAG: tetratricopeptide repeat protein [Rhodoferax sp.]|uniref:nuclear transport factor 2 family protein n=1 Tax=Rhodoferax sp. TaxID=50421 RepID=UPI0027270F30|nr:tetratricopeptide repeat protein [Rhodoferax sp.]MDO8449074.1 tetratricopeptide repeat protein [Rhodoferax sp.]
MTYARSTIFTTLRLLALAAAFASPAAHADEYGDVSQLLRAGKLNEAMIKADVYLAAKPRDPQMRFLKGVIQRNSGKQADAITTFTKLTEDYPELPEPYNNLAVLYAGQNQYDKARAALEMAIRTNPSYATAHENLGDVYARLASQAYNKALQLDGANAAVPPKLALIGEVFKPNIKGQTPAAAVPAAAPVAPVAKAPAALPAPAATPARVAAPVAPTAPPAAVATPTIAAAPVAAPAKPAVSDGSVTEAEAAVRAWAKAWSAKDMSAYLGAYAKEFTPSTKQSRSAWEEDRRKRIVGKASISVKLDNLTVTVNGNKAVAKFRQDYRADALAVSSRKTLELLKTGDKWLIVKESTGN